MALLTSEDFEGGTDGATVNSTNSIFTTAFGTTVTFDDTQSVTGNLSMLVDTTSSASMVGVEYGAHVVTYWRMYLHLDALPAANTYVMAMHASGTKQMDVRVTPTGAVTVRDGNVAVWTSATTVAAGEWFRMEGVCDSTAGAQQVRLFTGANVHGTTPDVTSGDVAYSGTAITNGTAGASNSTTAKFWIDDYAVDDANFPGPSIEPPADATNTYVSVGGAWVPAVPHVRVSGAWVPATATP